MLHATIANIFANIPSDRSGEIFDTLSSTGNVRIERIISSGQATPAGGWYEQGWDEWVLLLAGSAGLLIEGEDEARIMKPGDYLMIPALCRHRVTWTDPGQKTIWLAVHIGET